jgi:hypothetical protein
MPTCQFCRQEFEDIGFATYPGQHDWSACAEKTVINLYDRVAELEGTLESVRSFLRVRSFTPDNILVLTKLAKPEQLRRDACGGSTMPDRYGPSFS